MAQQQNIQTYQQLYQENNTLSVMYEEILLKYTEAFAQCTKYKKLSKHLRVKLVQKNGEIKKQQTNNKQSSSNTTKLKAQVNILKSYNENIKQQNERNKAKIEELTNANAKLQSNMITLTQKHHAKQRQLTRSKQKLLGQTETLKAALNTEQNKNLQLLQNVKTITEHHTEQIAQIEANTGHTAHTWQENEFLAEIGRLNNVIYAKDKFHAQLQSDNDLFRRELDDSRLEIAICNSQKQDKLVCRLNEQLERLQGEIKQYKEQQHSNSNIQSQCGDLLEVHTECEETIHSLTADKDALGKEITAMKREQIVIREENKKLMAAFDEFEVKLQIQEKSDDDTDQGSVFNPCDDYSEEKGDILDARDLILFDDELCIRLEEDLENYRSDQRRKKKLKELRLFHERKRQVLRDWKHSLFNNGYKTLWEIMLDKLEDKYDDYEGLEHAVYQILFYVVIECYEVLQSEYNKMAGNEYLSPNVVDMVLMNIANFYDLMKRNKLTKRIANICAYINGKVEKIYKCVEDRHVRYVDIDFKPDLCQFIVECCETIWSVLHYQCNIYPVNCVMNGSDIKYDDKIHEKEGDAEGDNIEFCAFPAIMKENEYQTKMWVICDEV